MTHTRARVERERPFCTASKGGPPPPTSGRHDNQHPLPMQTPQRPLPSTPRPAARPPPGPAPALPRAPSGLTWLTFSFLFLFGMADWWGGWGPARPESRSLPRGTVAVVAGAPPWPLPAALPPPSSSSRCSAGQAAPAPARRPPSGWAPLPHTPPRTARSFLLPRPLPDSKAALAEEEEERKEAASARVPPPWAELQRHLAIGRARSRGAGSSPPPALHRLLSRPRPLRVGAEERLTVPAGREAEAPRLSQPAPSFFGRRAPCQPPAVTRALLLSLNWRAWRAPALCSAYSSSNPSKCSCTWRS